MTTYSNCVQVDTCAAHSFRPSAIDNAFWLPGGTCLIGRLAVLILPQALVAALAALYAATFTSLLLQGPSLFGNGGLVPVAAHLKVSAEQLIGSPDYGRCVWKLHIRYLWPVTEPLQTAWNHADPCMPRSLHPLQPCPSPTRPPAADNMLAHHLPRPPHRRHPGPPPSSPLPPSCCPQTRSAPWRLFLVSPSLLWFHQSLGLSVDATQQALALAGLALSLLLLWAGGRGPLRLGAGPLPAALGTLWLLLLSARSVGQGFLGGSW